MNKKKIIYSLIGRKCFLHSPLTLSLRTSKYLLMVDYYMAQCNAIAYLECKFAKYDLENVYCYFEK